MVASKCLLVALAVVAVVGIARAQELDKDTQDCIKKVNNAVAGLSIPPAVEKFSELVRSSLPGVSPEDYPKLKDDSRYHIIAVSIPLDRCINVLKDLNELAEKSIEDDAECTRILSNPDLDDAILASLMQEPVMSHVFQVKQACYAFLPPGVAE